MCIFPVSQCSKSLDRIKRNDVSSITSATKTKSEKVVAKPELSPKSTKSGKKVRTVHMYIRILHMCIRTYIQR